MQNPCWRRLECSYIEPASRAHPINLNDLQSQVALGEDSRRLFIFDNRIEIVSPGHLPNNLTVAKIRAGNSIIRNPILVSFIAKGLLPYRGLGSGIKRALDD